MSGIAGIIRFDGAPVEAEQIKNMTAAMSYRGPDGINHWVRGSIALGQCMLRTTPESLEETQPLTNEDKSLVLTMDGRVDNWEDLRTDLLARGVALRNRSDAELVLRAYEVWGRDCVQHIDGDFALVIWDHRTGEAFCARDRMGNKPFHYYWDGKALVFASEVHPILAMPSVRNVLNEGMLAEIIADEWYSRDETLWAGIMRLVAAHTMTVTSRGPITDQYWAPDLWADLPCRTEEDYYEHYRELFFDAVRRLSRSHKSVGYEVSGGLDSSAVFCAAVALRNLDRLPAPGIEGYTIAFTDYAEANEISYARAVAEHVRVPIQEMAPDIKDFSWFVKRADRYNEFPGYPAGSAQTSLYEQAATQGVRVILTGSGGDHFLQGSRAYYAQELALRQWQNLFECFAADAKAFGAAHAGWWLIRHGMLPLLPKSLKTALREVTHYFEDKPIRSGYWLAPQMRDRLQGRRQRSNPVYGNAVRHRGQLYLLQALYYPFDAWGRELGERLCASFGIECRHPYVSANFVQFAFATPERLRLRGARDKYIHTQALRAILPPVIRERRIKADFAGLFSERIHTLNQEFTEFLPRDRAEWLDREGIARLLQSYVHNPGEGWQNWVLWNVLGCHLALPQNRTSL
jgi:asparagine synthase (glutamine-hydrolysing)